jgi:hypothetical protein
LRKYVWMPPHLSTILTLWICFTHVYTQFEIAPRVALVSENPNVGKSTALKVSRQLVFRPNQERSGTGAAIADFLSQGPGTVLLDELDTVDADGRRRLLQIWNLGHERGASTSLMRGGRRTLLPLHAPMLAAGIGGFLGPTQMSRAFMLEMEAYTAATKPECKFNSADVGDLDIIYSYLRNWAPRAALNPDPAMPPGVLRRFADNVQGLLAIADSCGEEWGRRAREAATVLLEKENAELPQRVIVRHGLLIFAVYELDQIGSVEFNKELLRLDLPDARWTRYRGASNAEHPHALRMDEQATLLRKVNIASEVCWPSGPRRPGTGFKGYKRASFEAARREYDVAAPEEAEVRRERLRLVGPSE